MSPLHCPSRHVPWVLATLCACLILIAVLPGSVAKAHPPRFSPSSASYDVVLEDDHGRPLRSFWHAGERFVLGELGQRYAVRITNRSAVRVEAVLTVDGRDAISGRPGDYVNQRGYLIAPFDSVVVRGFRKSLSEVATFRFTDPGDSYSSRMGTPENVGVIGVALFPEAHPRRPRPLPFAERPSARRRSPHRSTKPRRKNPNPRAGEGRRTAPSSEQQSAPPSADRSASPRADRSSPSTSDRRARSRRRSARSRGSDNRYDGYQPPREEVPRAERDNLGTRYGEGRTSRVREVPFERRDPRHPSEVITLRYDDAEGLEARGIHVWPEPRPRPWWRPHHPVAFPENRFAPPPP